MGAQRWEDVRESVIAGLIGSGFTAAALIAASLALWPEFFVAFV